MMRNVMVVIVISMMITAGCRGPAVPSSLVGSWRHEVNWSIWRDFALDGSQVAELGLTFDSSGHCTQHIKFLDGRETTHDTLTVTLEKDADGQGQIVLSNEGGLFADGRITLSDDSTLTITAPALSPLKFTFQRVIDE